jgi:hypothetical protein
MQQLLDDYYKASDIIADAAISEFLKVIGTLDLEDARNVSEVLQVLYPEVIPEYANMQAALAADIYDELRDASKARKAYRAIPAAVADSEALTATARWSVGPLFGVIEKDTFIYNVESSVERHVLTAGRDTFFQNTALDAKKTGTKARYARIARPNCCDFCQMLAGRGAVYHSEKSAGEMTKYHDKCRCFATVQFN